MKDSLIYCTTESSEIVLPEFFLYAMFMFSGDGSGDEPFMPGLILHTYLYNDNVYGCS